MKYHKLSLIAALLVVVTGVLFYQELYERRYAYQTNRSKPIVDKVISFADNYYTTHKQFPKEIEIEAALTEHFDKITFQTSDEFCSQLKIQGETVEQCIPQTAIRKEVAINPGKCDGFGFGCKILILMTMVALDR
jgi:hypothetical protein